MQPQSDMTVTWKWVVSALLGLLTLTGGAVWSNLQGQVTDIKVKQESASQKDATTQSDVAVIKEKLRVIEENQREQRDATKEQSRKLDELRDLLRRR